MFFYELLHNQELLSKRFPQLTHTLPAVSGRCAEISWRAGNHRSMSSLLPAAHTAVGAALGGLDIPACTFEHRLQKWILTAGQVAKPIALPPSITRPLNQS